MRGEQCGSPAIFARFGRKELADLYYCDRKLGHKSDHSALHPRGKDRIRWSREYPAPSPDRIREAEQAIASLTPELEAAVLAEEDREQEAWAAAHPNRANLLTPH